MNEVPTSGLSVLALGPPGPEKTAWGFALPGPTAAITGNDGLRSFAKDHRFLHAPARPIQEAIDFLDSALEPADHPALRTVILQGINPWWAEGEREATQRERTTLAAALDRLKAADVNLWVSAACHVSSPRLPAPSTYIDDLGAMMDVVVQLDTRGRLTFSRFFEQGARGLDLLAERIPHLVVTALQTGAASHLKLSERAWAGLLNAKDRVVRERAMTLIGDRRR